jgi:hypothetical protein
MPQFFAFLRAINAGPQRVARMSVLRQTFESLGFFGVETFLGSGNVVFETRPLLPARAAHVVPFGCSLIARFRRMSSGVETRVLSPVARHTIPIAETRKKGNPLCSDSSSAPGNGGSPKPTGRYLIGGHTMVTR